jgi:hypothetical protein
MSKLKEFLDRVNGDIEKVFDLQGEIKAPLWFAFTADERSILIPTPLEGPEHKDVVAAAVREIFQDQDVVRYVHVAEAWALMQATQEQLDETKDKSVKDIEGRTEVVLLSAEDKETGESYLYLREIDRSGPRPVLKASPDDGKGWLSEGRFVSMFKEHGKQVRH